MVFGYGMGLSEDYGEHGWRPIDRWRWRGVTFMYIYTLTSHIYNIDISIGLGGA
jgi:hypothetical protein